MPRDESDEISHRLGPFPNRVEVFFLDTLDDLRTRLKGSGEYNTVRAAALLRQLLLDPEPLLDAANRETRVKILYEIPDLPRFPVENDEERPLLSWSTLGSKGGVRKTVNRDGLLSTILMSYKEHSFTVRDVIKSVSNLYGGVHLDEPGDIHEASLLAFNDFFSFRLTGGAMVTAIHGIGDVVLAATELLANAIVERSNILPSTWEHMKALAAQAERSSDQSVPGE